MRRILIKKAFLSISFIIPILWCSFTHAEFELNFKPVETPVTLSDFPKGGYDNTGQAFSCPNAANPDCFNGTQQSTDTTPFFYERVDGYWHIIVGDQGTEFIQESYIPILGLFHSYSGGREPVFFTLDGNLEQWSGNGWDPLGVNHDTYGVDNSSFTGNGTGDPTKVLVRQVMGPGTLGNTGTRVEEWTCTGGAFCQEFLKSEEAFKPIIKQSYSGADLIMNFSLDMSSILYTDKDTPAVFTNVIEVIDPDFPLPNTMGATAPAPNKFDMATDSQHSTVNAGQYLYVTGVSWYDDMDGDLFRAYGEGTYIYENGTSNFHADTDWAAFLDPTQNAAGEHPGNEARCAEEILDACTAPPWTF